MQEKDSIMVLSISTLQPLKILIVSPYTKSFEPAHVKTDLSYMQTANTQASLEIWPQWIAAHVRWKERKPHNV